MSAELSRLLCVTPRGQSQMAIPPNWWKKLSHVFLHICIGLHRSKVKRRSVNCIADDSVSWQNIGFLDRYFDGMFGCWKQQDYIFAAICTDITEIWHASHCEAIKLNCQSSVHRKEISLLCSDGTCFVIMITCHCKWEGVYGERWFVWPESRSIPAQFRKHVDTSIPLRCPIKLGAPCSRLICQLQDFIHSSKISKGWIQWSLDHSQFNFLKGVAICCNLQSMKSSYDTSLFSPPKLRKNSA